MVLIIFSRPYYLAWSLLCYSVASVCTECIVAKRCVLEKKLLKAYRKLHMRNWLVSKWMTLTFV